MICPHLLSHLLWGLSPPRIRQCLNLVSLLAGRLAALPKLFNLLIDRLQLFSELALFFLVVSCLVELDLPPRKRREAELTPTRT